MASQWRRKQRFFVFLRCAPGRALDVGKTIAATKLGAFSEIHSVTGDWDLVLRAEFNSDENFGQAISELFKGIPEIERTYTVAAYLIWDPDDIYFEEDAD